MPTSRKSISWTQVFKSSSELETYFHHLGFKIAITQISNGKLIGRISCNIRSDIKFFHIESNLALLFYGDHNPNFISIAVETGTNREYTKSHGCSLPISSIAGYGIQKSEYFYSVSPGSSMYFVILPSIAFQGLSYQLSGEQSIDQLQSTNMMQVNDNKFLHLERFCQAWTYHQTNTPINPDTFLNDTMIYIHDLLNSNSSDNYMISNFCKPLVREFIELCLSSKPHRPVQVSDVLSNLFTSKTHLNTQIKKAIGLSPLKFMRYVRLEQVRKELLMSEGRANIGELARRHGFSSRGHFAKNYNELFGEKPTETLYKFLL